MRVTDVQTDNLLMRYSQLGVEMILGNYIDRFSNEVMRIDYATQVQNQFDFRTKSN